MYHHNNEWPWLPSANPNTEVVLPKLETVTLQYTPFKWSSPMLKTNLRSLNLRTVPTTSIPVDRVLHIISNNKSLEELALHFTTVLNPVLPLTQTALPDLKTLSLGGHYLMASLIDSLVTPNLCSLTLNIDARDPIDDSISNLVVRSSHPAIHSLSIAYGSNGPPLRHAWRPRRRGAWSHVSIPRTPRVAWMPCTLGWRHEARPDGRRPKPG